MVADRRALRPEAHIVSFPRTVMASVPSSGAQSRGSRRRRHPRARRSARSCQRPTVAAHRAARRQVAPPAVPLERPSVHAERCRVVEGAAWKVSIRKPYRGSNPPSPPPTPTKLDNTGSGSVLAGSAHGTLIVHARRVLLRSRERVPQARIFVPGCAIESASLSRRRKRAFRPS